jgi:hypothetical protein
MVCGCLLGGCVFCGGRAGEGLITAVDLASRVAAVDLASRVAADDVDV